MTEQDNGVSPSGPGSQASPEAAGASSPSVSIPNAAPKCECQSVGVLNPDYAGWYDSETELPFVNHQPGECACTNDLALYRSDDGQVRWLCSCCHTFSDVRVEAAIAKATGNA